MPVGHLKLNLLVSLFETKKVWKNQAPSFIQQPWKTAVLMPLGANHLMELTDLLPQVFGDLIVTDRPWSLVIFPHSDCLHDLKGYFNREFYVKLSNSLSNRFTKEGGGWWWWWWWAQHIENVFLSVQPSQMNYFHISVPRGSMIAFQWSIFQPAPKNKTLMFHTDLKAIDLPLGHREERNSWTLGREKLCLKQKN